MSDLTPCPVGCGRSQKPGKLMCYHCWREVPRDLQRAVLRTWGAFRRAPLTARSARLAEYREARDAAIGSIT